MPDLTLRWRSRAPDKHPPAIPQREQDDACKAISSSIAADFSRIQFTSDLLPAEIMGTSIYDLREARFNWLPGPVFAPVLLADKINRATPGPRTRCWR